MERAVDYARRAEQAERLAKSVTDPKVRANFLAVASEWRNLARQAEELAKEEARLRDADGPDRQSSVQRPGDPA